MAFSRKKPVPTRRGRLKKETTVTETTEVSGEPVAVVEVPAEEAVTETTTTTRRTTTAAQAATTGSGSGLEMALVVVTLVSLVAAFGLIQLGMHRAFGSGWPV